MTTGYEEIIPNENGLYCYSCNELLVSDKVILTYMKSTFPTQLLRCPKCGLVYIDEEMVATKATEVEMVLEEK